MKDLLKSNILRAIAVIIAALIILVGVFALGVNIGERKGNHFSRRAENNFRFQRPSPFQRPSFPMMMPFLQGLPDTHGAFGIITSVSGTTMIVQGNDDLEKTVLITSSTAIRVGKNTGSATDLQPNASVSVFGAPNDKGEIEARLIRINPSR